MRIILKIGIVIYHLVTLVGETCSHQLSSLLLSGILEHLLTLNHYVSYLHYISQKKKLKVSWFVVAYGSISITRHWLINHLLRHVDVFSRHDVFTLLRGQASNVVLSFVTKLANQCCL